MTEEHPPYTAPRLCAGDGIYYSLTNPEKHLGVTEYPTTSWPDIVWMASNPQELTPVLKEYGWWVIASDCINRQARQKHMQREHGRFWILIADVDQGNLPLATVGDGVAAALDPGTEYLIYATRSSKTDDKRWKIMVHLGKPCPGAFYHHFAEQFNLALAASLGVGMDACTDREHQVTFLPNPGDHYEFLHHPGAPFGDAEDNTLAVALVNVARQAEAQRPREAYGSSRKTVQGRYIEAFNKKFPTEQLLERYGFEAHPKDNKWHHPNQGSGQYSTDVKDDGVWLTGSPTVASLIGRAGGDAFDLYVAFECGGDRDQAYRNICKAVDTNWGEVPQIQWGRYITCNGEKIKLGVVQ